MSPAVAQLFYQLVDLSPEARAKYLAEHPVNPDVRREVESLLAHDLVNTDPLAQRIVFEAAQTLLRFDAKGARCGAFRLVSVIGRGGMGVVYLAERVDGEVTQRAAVKLMQPGWSDVHRERFLQEREILAALTHPNIAHLLDAGHLEDGQPYLAMEYVEGEPIDRYCEKFSVPQKVEMMLKVCRAVAYLHRNAVVHRDLKPSNILVTALGDPKLLDFGIAKMLDPGGDLTVTHMRMLTPDYASPEQVRGATVGPTSDIYSLGAVLHQLITGKPPQDTRPGPLAPELKGDLGVILQTALRHEPHERYASVDEFADDLKAFLESRPIRARQGERVYRAVKFLRRYRLTAALTGAVAAVFLIAAGFAWFGLSWYGSRPTATLKNLRPERLTANTPELAIQTAAISPDGKSVAYSDLLGVHVRDMATGETRLLPGTNGHVLVQWMPDSASLQTQIQDAEGGTSMMLVFPSGQPPVAAPAADNSVVSPDRKHRAAVPEDRNRLLVEDTNGGNSRELWRAAAKSVLSEFHWSPNSSQVAILSSKEGVSTLEVIDIATAKSTVVVPEDRNLPILSMVWVNQNRMILAIREQNSADSNLWELRVTAAGVPVSGGLRALTSWTDFPIRSGSLTTDGTRLVFVRSLLQRDVYVAGIDADRTRIEIPRRLTLDLGDDYPSAWTRDSKAVILTSNRNGQRTIFRQNLDKQTADRMVSYPGSQILGRVAPDGESVLFVNNDRAKGTRRLMRVAVAGGIPEPLPDVPDFVDFRCSRVGPCIVTQTVGDEYVTSSLDLVKGKGREIFRDAQRNYGTPDISPDGKLLAKPFGAQITIRSSSTGAVVREIPVRGVTNLNSIDFAPDGKGFYTGDAEVSDARLLYVDLSGKVSVLWRQPGNTLIWAIPSPDGKYLALMIYTDDSNVYMVENF